MIKTTVTLICDRCGREIKAGDRYYVENIGLCHFLWDGENLNDIEGEDMDHRTRDLCEECRVGLYGPVKAADDPTESELIPAATEEPVIAELPMTENVTVEEMPLAVEVVPEPVEPPIVAEDVATGEAVELDGKTYTVYQPEEGIPDPIIPEPTPETREVAERIIAMGEKTEKKRKRRLTDAQKEQIVRMMQDGTTMDKVAKTVGCSPQTVCNVWHKYDANQEAQDGR